MFRPDYCCCAIPLVNVGIYSLMSEQFVSHRLVEILFHGSSDLPFRFALLGFGHSRWSLDDSDTLK